jgi:hypothetical protein
MPARQQFPNEIQKKCWIFDRYNLRFLRSCSANFNIALSIPVQGYSLISAGIFHSGPFRRFTNRGATPFARIQPVSRRAGFSGDAIDRAVRVAEVSCNGFTQPINRPTNQPTADT